MFPPADTTMDRLIQGHANSPTQGFLGLPDELLLQVISYLSLSDVMLVRKVFLTFVTRALLFGVIIRVSGAEDFEGISGEE